MQVNFVTHAWLDIRKKMEKMEDWHDKSLNDLLKEVQRVYVRRDEEKAKLDAKIIIATMRQSNFQRNLNPPSTTPKHSGFREREKGRNRILAQSKFQEQSRTVCFYCWEEGQYKRECPHLKKDLKIFQEIQPEEE